MGFSLKFVDSSWSDISENIAAMDEETKEDWIAADARQYGAADKTAYVTVNYTGETLESTVTPTAKPTVKPTATPKPTETANGANTEANKTDENDNVLTTDSNIPENTMPLMSGTSLNTIIKKAAEFNVVKKYDDDFGQGTRCRSFCNSEGGLMLDVIYDSDSKEILYASIITNKLSSSTEQKKFIESMAPVLCPQSDVESVSAWVNANIGKKAETEINSFSYELLVGAVDNLLYYVGTESWETWESAQ